MGRRSRKRFGPEGTDDFAPTSARSSRAERDDARRRRAAAAPKDGSKPKGRRSRQRDERPPPPWGSFPLTELVVLLGIVFGVVGVILGGDRGRTMVAAAFALCCLAGLEVSIRDHFAGYRSHSSLLAGSLAIGAMILVLFAVGSGALAVGQVLGAGAVVFGATFWALRRAFAKRSGGLTFR